MCVAVVNAKKTHNLHFHWTNLKEREKCLDLDWKTKRNKKRVPSDNDSKNLPVKTAAVFAFWRTCQLADDDKSALSFVFIYLIHSWITERDAI